MPDTLPFTRGELDTLFSLMEHIERESAVYLTNATSRVPPFRGPGRVLTIMAAPRRAYGECGEGTVPALVPPLEWVRATKALEMDLDDYRTRYEARLREKLPELGPGRLAFGLEPNIGTRFVQAGDTLICSCSREQAHHGRCHRVWAAHILREAGWSVVLDGQLLPPRSP